MEKKDPTIKDIFEVLSAFSTQVDERFNNIDQKFLQIDKRFEQIDKRFEQIDNRFEQIDKRFYRIENKMITKDYLADKLADLRGDVEGVTQKEDKKLNTLIEMLNTKEVLDEEERTKLLSMPPFVQV